MLAPDMAEPQHGRELSGRIAFAALSAALLGLYVWVAFGLAGDADVLPHSSGIYDMDVMRVVVDLTTRQPGHRASAHPLQKLLLAPLGQLVALLTHDRLVAAKTLALLATWLGAMAAGALARAFTGGAWLPAIAATALTGSSFAFLLAAGIPESATFAGLATSAPLLFWLCRRGRALGTSEVLGWGVLATLAFGLTFTQVVNVAVAFGARLWDQHGNGIPMRRLLWRAVAVLLTSVGLAVALGEAQARLYPGTPRFWTEDAIATELPFVRTSAISLTPFSHTGRLLLHFGVIDFAAPMPGLSDFLMLDYNIPTWSLSLEEAGWEEWRPAQLALAATLLATLATALLVGRWRDPLLLAPCILLVFHFVLHWFYGREYIIYSPQWHGVLVATLVAGVWNGGRGRKAFGVVSGLLVAALLANNVAVLRASYEEVAWGLGTERRGPSGQRLPGAADVPYSR